MKLQHGIYYAYWEQKWSADYIYYIEKVAGLGFDILEIAATPIPAYSKDKLSEIRKAALDYGLKLTAGHGPSYEQDVSSSDPKIRNGAFEFYKKLFAALEQLDINLIGGALYSYWPVDYGKPVDKGETWKRSIEGVLKLSTIAREYNITICMEVLNRFENFLINTAEEGCEYIKQIGENNVKLMLDTFHMNIEEESFGEAIRKTGKYLGHFHTGECNRMVPGKGRIPWKEIGDALSDIGYNQAVVMEPFVQMGGRVGQDVKLWREMYPNISEEKLDEDARQALNFQRYLLNR